MNVLLRQGKMRVVFGLRFETGEEKIRKATLGTWGLGRRIDLKNWV
jgi:hypothetical protein